MSESAFPARADPLPTAREISERVARRERELREAIADLGEALKTSVDWKKVVEDRPLESALVVAALGFAAGYRPSLLGKPGDAAIRRLAEVGAEALVRALTARSDA